MEQPSTSSKWKRYIPVPANMLMIYVTHWPLSAYTTHVEIGNRYPMQAKHRYMKPKGRLLDFETISGNFWFSMEKWMTSRYHTLLLYPFCNVGNVNPWLYLLSFNIVPSTGVQLI